MSSYGLLNGGFNDKILFSIELVKQKGNYLIDSSNKKYLDFRSSLWNASIGYDSEIYQTISNEFQYTLTKGISFSDMHAFKNPLYNKVSQKILEISNQHFSKVIFTNSESENTELIFKIINYINPKSELSKILAFSHAYHGNFFGGMMISGNDRAVNKVFANLYEQVTFIDYPKCVADEKHILNEIDKIASQYDVMFIEPVLINYGIYTFNIEFLNKLMKILKAHNVITVFDENITGFYKTGLLFYYHHLQEIPDIISLGQGINNGIVPFGCVCVNDDIDSRLTDSYCVKKHFSIQNGNLLGMLSANIVLNYYQQHHDEIQSRINKLSYIITDVCNDYQLIYRNIGIITAIEVSSHVHILQCVRELLNLGILVNFYINEQSQGLVITPQFDMDECKLREALILIAQKVAT